MRYFVRFFTIVIIAKNWDNHTSFDTICDDIFLYPQAACLEEVDVDQGKNG